MSASGSFAPPGETASDLWVERSNLNGVILSGVGYGILFTLTFQTLFLLIQQPKSKTSWSLIGYISLVFTLATLGFAGNAKFNQQTYIDDRNIPGGPNAFTAEFYSEWVNMMSFGSYVLMSWLADGLVLWRFTLIWEKKYWFALFPSLIFLGSISSSIALLVSMTRPGADFWTQEAVKFGIAYWSLSISLNIILTVLIAGRIWFTRKRIVQALGRQHSGSYISIAAMLIESASLYSGWSMVFLICYARNTPLQNILLPPLGQVQGIAPMLILFRVAQGRAWSETTLHTTTISGRRKGNTTIPLTDLSTTVGGPGNSRDGFKISVTTESVSQWDGGKDASV
ncbi:hypothetical protein MVEN_01456100 [Mycena venus]|uniref:Uncharacterized protein n=1 Tax=Mycena venus TaxID=2733690 RepID=A0A8H6XTQ7_9AGAR|nr:hypothetical protein MVEN_01456100 [Mycena venus]